MSITVHQFACLTDNYGFLVRDNASGLVACIDTPDADAVLDELARLGWSLDYIFNTHWHPEQTGSNESLGQAGATIVAQENTKQWLTTDVTWPWNDETVEPLPKVGLPNKTFYEDTALKVGGRNVPGRR